MPKRIQIYLSCIYCIIWVYTMSMNKFKYLLSPENVYIVTLQDSEGNDFTAHIKGVDIITQLSSQHALGKFEYKLDKDDDK